jgi:hypothetical protein
MLGDDFIDILINPVVDLGNAGGRYINDVPGL